MMTTVRTTAELQAAIEAGTDPKTIQIAEPKDSTVEAFDMDKIKADAQQEGANKERERCQGIHALALPGFEKEIATAIEDGSSVEATGLALFKAAQDRGISLDAIQADATKVSTTPPPSDDKEGEERKEAVGAITSRWK